MTRSLTHAEARALRPWLYEGPVVRDFPFIETRASSEPARLSASQPVDPAGQVAGTIAGYVARWATPVPTSADVHGTPGRRLAYASTAFDEWLQTATPGAVVVQRDHLDPILGRWLWLEADDYGLLAEAAIFDTVNGRQALDDARSGKLRALSSRALHHDRDTTRASDDLGEYLVVHRATLHEAGPVGAPADPGARIVAVDGQRVAARTAAVDLEHMSVDDFLNGVEQLTGVSAADISFRQQVAEHRRKADLAEQVDRVERCVSEIRRARLRVAHLWGCYRSRLATYTEVREAVLEAEQHEEWLRANVFRTTADSLLAGMPPKFNLTHAMLDSARPARW